MNFEQFRQQIPAEVFDYGLLTNFLKELSKPRDKISSWVAEGKIIRVKKGLYVFGEDWRYAPLHLESIANLIYGPSCVSFEYALTRYGLLAERSVVITSLTIGKSKTFQTPIGIFEYRAIDRKKFKIGIEYRDLGAQGGYFFASREKALADLVYRTPGIRTCEQLRHFLFEEIRLDKAAWQDLDFQLLNEISKVYHKSTVSMLIRI